MIRYALGVFGLSYAHYDSWCTLWYIIFGLFSTFKFLEAGYMSPAASPKALSFHCYPMIDKFTISNAGISNSHETWSFYTKLAEITFQYTYFYFKSKGTCPQEYNLVNIICKTILGLKYSFFRSVFRILPSFVLLDATILSSHHSIQLYFNIFYI